MLSDMKQVNLMIIIITITLTDSLFASHSTEKENKVTQDGAIYDLLVLRDVSWNLANFLRSQTLLPECNASSLTHRSKNNYFLPFNHKMFLNRPQITPSTYYRAVAVIRIC